MKKLKMNEKLAFNKETVAKLSDDNMSQVNGGKNFLSLGLECTTISDCDCAGSGTKGLFCGVRTPKLA
jgi:hypothetical protein